MIENVQNVRQSQKIMGGPMPLRERGCAIEHASLSVRSFFRRQIND